MNRVFISGRLTDDFCVENGESQNKRIRFCIANNDFGKEKAYFFWITAFGKTAEKVEKYAKKGNLVEIEGHLDLSSYIKNDIKYNAVNIIADYFRMLSVSLKSVSPLEDFHNEKTGM